MLQADKLSAGGSAWARVPDSLINALRGSRTLALILSRIVEIILASLFLRAQAARRREVRAMMQDGALRASSLNTCGGGSQQLQSPGR